MLVASAYLWACLHLCLHPPLTLKQQPEHRPKHQHQQQRRQCGDKHRHQASARQRAYCLSCCRVFIASSRMPRGACLIVRSSLSRSIS